MTRVLGETKVVRQAYGKVASSTEKARYFIQSGEKRWSKSDYISGQQMVGPGMARACVGTPD